VLAVFVFIMDYYWLASRRFAGRSSVRLRYPPQAADILTAAFFFMYTVYILYSQQKDKYYIGQTEDLAKRLSEHNLRKNLGASDWIIAYSESYNTRSEAMKRELEIKGKKRRSYIEALINNGLKNFD